MLGTQIIPGIGIGGFTTSYFTTGNASRTGSELSGKKNATSTLLAIIVPLIIILLIIAIVIVVTIVVIIKWRRRRKTHSKVHGGERN
jgi:heme/copper-type cytochrome/quinol oxidase subunit 2